MLCEICSTWARDAAMSVEDHHPNCPRHPANAGKPTPPQRDALALLTLQNSYRHVVAWNIAWDDSLGYRVEVTSLAFHNFTAAGETLAEAILAALTSAGILRS